MVGVFERRAVGFTMPFSAQSSEAGAAAFCQCSGAFRFCLHTWTTAPEVHVIDASCSEGIISHSRLNNQHLVRYEFVCAL